jgi:hypothetical protein
MRSQELPSQPHAAPLLQLNKPPTRPTPDVLHHQAAKSSIQRGSPHHGTSWDGFKTDLTIARHHSRCKARTNVWRAVRYRKAALSITPRWRHRRALAALFSPMDSTVPSSPRTPHHLRHAPVPQVDRWASGATGALATPKTGFPLQGAAWRRVRRAHGGDHTISSARVAPLRS